MQISQSATAWMRRTNLRTIWRIHSALSYRATLKMIFFYGFRCIVLCLHIFSYQTMLFAVKLHLGPLAICLTDCPRVIRPLLGCQAGRAWSGRLALVRLALAMKAGHVARQYPGSGDLVTEHFMEGSLSVPVGLSFINAEQCCQVGTWWISLYHSQK